MNQYLFDLKTSALEKRVEEIAGILTRIESKMAKEEDLWDNSDLIRNWKVSVRTLADWRSKGLIEYTKIGGKIYYTSEDRQNFLNNNHVNNQAHE